MAHAPLLRPYPQPRKASSCFSHPCGFKLFQFSTHYLDFYLSSVLAASFSTSTTTSTCWQMSFSTSVQQSTPSSTTWCLQTSDRSSSLHSHSCACPGGRRRSDWPSPGNPTASPATTRFPARSQGKLRTEAKGGREMHFIVESKLERGLCDFHAWSPNSHNMSAFSKVIFVGKIGFVLPVTLRLF